ncbi:hypothetical protein PQX77_001445 [Marasmius sp. AFHP31]|nr:hypothetical protein PQX77_001445 [Marasmius sp. AFHP31]
MHHIPIPQLDALIRRLRDIARQATSETWNSADGVLVPQKFPPRTGDTDNVASQRLLRSYFNLALDDGVPDLNIYFRAYLASQYKALVNQANSTSGFPHFYGDGFRPEGQLNVDAQLLAITTLLGGVISGDDTTPNDPGGSDIENHGQVPIGAIVGGVIGGVLGLGFVIAGSYCCLQRRRKLQRSPPAVEPYSTTKSSMSPFSTVLPFRPGKYHKGRVPSASPNISTSTCHEPSILTTPDLAPEPQSSRMREATTAELVMLLNQRLGHEPRDENDGHEQWDTNQRPPDYSSQAGSGKV